MLAFSCQGDHPVWNDSQFVNPPTAFGCNSSQRSLIHGVQCDSSKFLQDTELRCGDPIKFTNETSAEECCATCQATNQCTHWVYAPTDVTLQGMHVNTALGGNCHIKELKENCPSHKPGATSGGPTPPAPPAANAVCTNEYSTDLWGQMALQTVADHDLAIGPLYIHLCFEAVHTPYDPAPGDPTGNTYKGLLWRADVFIGELVTMLKARGMYDNTLIVYAADNGGKILRL